MIHRWPLAALSLLLLGIVGCAPHTLKPIDSWEEHQARVAALESWQISGKLGARLPDNSGSARLRWDQDRDEFRIDLSGPFGQGRTVITGTPGSVTLDQGDDELLEAASAEELIWLATGWLVPVDQLLYWVRGVPSPETQARRMKRDDDGLLSELEQDGWHLRYSNYTLVDGHWHLPRRIIASRDEVRLTLVIHNWSPHHAELR
ncbi:lipoprotein insertase outer membrane protein LolB [Marinimicrobium sp. ABcell2]|uniref:lipoprotein insertase outer membrane protein LolB n=1 Tax=Marinimicrobium sp. ABcell2 TaxID=3069751 RepID=UPI0027AF1A60|nr:lipoprotein insertase outer membrane protein LolB [Marinimicrobium sp. ABcell2]MDQ2077639.1 lipoprotein insertase outer membrane protein LolB [Marinimicrobium sp. ABcell2]